MKTFFDYRNDIPIFEEQQDSIRGGRGLQLAPIEPDRCSLQRCFRRNGYQIAYQQRVPLGSRDRPGFLSGSMPLKTLL